MKGSELLSVLDILEASSTDRSFFRTIPGPVNSPSLAALWRQSEDAARFLRNRTGPGAVGMVLWPSSECVAALIGGLRAGLRIASLPLPARAMPLDEYITQLKTIDALFSMDLLVVDDEMAPLLAGLDLPIRTATFSETARGGPPGPVDSDGILIQFTSGSTGAPKGVELTMGAIGANVTAIRERLGCFGLPDHLVSCSWLPLSHDMGLIGMTIATWAAQSMVKSGGIIAIRPDHFLRRPESWLTACSESRAWVTATPNFGLEHAMKRVPAVGSLDLSPLEVCIVGAEPVQAATLRRFATEFAPAGFDTQALCPAYGMAEASLAISLSPPRTPWVTRSVSSAALEQGEWRDSTGGDDIELVGLGQPLTGMSVATQTGDVGELRVRGPSMLTRYHGAEDPRTPEGWFPTKDLGAVVDEEVFVVGRTDDMLIIAGRNLHAHDLEAAAAAVSGIRRHSTAAVPYGAGHYALILEPPADARVSDLKALCRDVRRAVAQRVGVGPAAVFVIARGSFPRTPSGKPQRRRLAGQLRKESLPIETATHFR
ncbi:AMP-binding protein [Nonomuraea sp. NPDC046802]|uniref:AMP-binding protein n=1 Tax=Nonomuraea sp. NPDC046802 TaxID=3154919 RepID=UPI003401795C